MKGKGTLAASDVSGVNEVIYETEQKIKNITYQLCDYTEVDDVNISAEEVRMLSAQDVTAAKINPKMIIAVVGEKDLTFGLLRMWEIYADEHPFETHVFRTIEEAKLWISDKLESRARLSN